MVDRPGDPGEGAQPQKKRKTVPGLALAKKRLAVFLADEGFRAALARATTASKSAKGGSSRTVSRKSFGSSCSGAALAAPSVTPGTINLPASS